MAYEEVLAARIRGLVAGEPRAGAWRHHDRET
jgi:hypothetical protein